MLFHLMMPLHTLLLCSNLKNVSTSPCLTGVEQTRRGQNRVNLSALRLGLTMLICKYHASLCYTIFHIFWIRYFTIQCDTRFYNKHQVSMRQYADHGQTKLPVLVSEEAVAAGQLMQPGSESDGAQCYLQPPSYMAGGRIGLYERGPGLQDS